MLLISSRIEFWFVRVSPNFFKTVSFKGCITYLSVVISSCILYTRHDHILSFLSISFQTVSLLSSKKSFCFRLINDILLHSQIIYTHSCGLSIGILNHSRHWLTLLASGMSALSEQVIPGGQNVPSKFQSSECVAAMSGTHRNCRSARSPIKL